MSNHKLTFLLGNVGVQRQRRWRRWLSPYTHTHTHPPTNTRTHPPRSHPLPASRLGEKQDTGDGEDGHLPKHTHPPTPTPCSHPLPDSRLGEKQDPGVSHLHLPLQDAGPSLARLSSSARSNFSSHPVVTWHRTLLGTGGSEQEAR